ncbi:MAG: outer membrane beta-barrel protein, partial [Steroidobacteraceae bacterium]
RQRQRRRGVGVKAATSQKVHVVCAALSIAGITPGCLLAEPNPAPDAPAAPAVSKLAQVLDATGIAISGYVAASYYHSSGASTFHQFDIEHDTFQLDQAGLTLAYQPKEGFGALVNLIAGEDARVINAAENGTNSVFNLTQAFVQYAKGPVTVMGGKFVTLAGAEVINPTLDTNFSRSLLFYSEPLTHTGLRATYAVTDTLNVIAGINNGWNTTSTSYGSKTGEFGLAFTPNRIFSLTAQAYVGKDESFNANRTLFDTVATYNATSSLALILNYARGRQAQQPVSVSGPGSGSGSEPQSGFASGNLDWDVIAGYANYAFNDQWRVSVRGELLDDRDGLVTSTPQKIREGTLTVGRQFNRFELRLEGRYDTSNESTFESRVNGLPTFGDHQSGFALQGLYKF